MAITRILFVGAICTEELGSCQDFTICVEGEQEAMQNMTIKPPIKFFICFILSCYKNQDDIHKGFDFFKRLALFCSSPGSDAYARKTSRCDIFLFAQCHHSKSATQCQVHEMFHSAFGIPAIP